MAKLEDMARARPMYLKKVVSMVSTILIIAGDDRSIEEASPCWTRARLTSTVYCESIEKSGERRTCLLT